MRKTAMRMTALLLALSLMLCAPAVLASDTVTVSSVQSTAAPGDTFRVYGGGTKDGGGSLKAADLTWTTDSGYVAFSRASGDYAYFTVASDCPEGSVNIYGKYGSVTGSDSVYISTGNASSGAASGAASEGVDGFEVFLTYGGNTRMIASNYAGNEAATGRLDVFVGDSFTLRGDTLFASGAYREDGVVTLTSGDTVLSAAGNAGTYRAERTGSAVVEVRSSGAASFRAQITVAVHQENSGVSAVSFSRERVELAPGEYAPLELVVYPAGAPCDVTWSVRDPAIASVSAGSGLAATVAANATGTTVITAAVFDRTNRKTVNATTTVAVTAADYSANSSTLEVLAGTKLEAGKLADEIAGKFRAATGAALGGGASVRFATLPVYGSLTLAGGNSIGINTEYSYALLRGMEYSARSAGADSLRYTAVSGLAVMRGTLTLRVTAPKPQLFSDVSGSAYYADALEWAYQETVTTGRGDGTFDPAGTLTRADALTFLWRCVGHPEPASVVNPFSDVQSTEYWFKPVLWAYYAGITTGTDAAHFSPRDTLTRAHMITFIWRAKGRPGITGAGEWYADAVSWATGKGALNGTAVAFSAEGTNFCPRSDAIYYLYKVYG